MAIRTPAAQTWLVKRVAAYLSGELKTKVTLDRIEIEFFRTVSIKGLYVEDLQHDTLLYAGEISSVIDMFAPGDNKISLSGVDLNDAVVKLQKYKNIKGLNIDFIVDYFSASKKDTTPTKPFDFNPGEVRLNNVTFVYRDHRYNDVAKGIDFEDIRVLNIGADIDNVRFDADTLYATIENISFVERSGFKLEYFETNARFTSKSMEFENLLIKTPYSQLQTKLAFNFDDISDFDEFVEKVHMNSDFEESTLSSKDLTYFAKELEGLDHEINFNGKIKGTVSHLKGRDLEINFANHSYFKGDISIAGLPDFEESFFDIIVDKLVTDKKDIETIPQYPFTNKIPIELPENLSTLGKVEVEGKFTGFLNDFVAYGNAKTAIGFVSSDINLKIDNQVNKSSYSGHLAAIGFDVGIITGSTNILGKTTFKAEVKGSGFSLNNVKAEMDGVISSIELNKYDYKNIILNGQIAKKLFNGSLSVHENNLDLDFKGAIDLSTKIPVYDFTSNIANAHLANLNLINRDSSSVFGTTAQINLKGKDLDDLNGAITLLNTSYSELNKTISLDSIYLWTYHEENRNEATLRSDIVDLDLSGTYSHTTIFDEVKNLLMAYFPTFESENKHEQVPINFNYSVTIKKTDELLSIFYPLLNISKGSTAYGIAKNGPRNFELNVKSDSISFDEIKFSGINIRTKTSGPQLAFSNRFKEISISDTLRLLNAGLDGKTDKYKSSVTVSTSSRDSANAFVALKAEANFLSSGKTLVKLLPSTIILDGNSWQVDEINSVLFDSSAIDLNNIAFISKNERLSINGTISESKDDRVTLTLKNFNTRVLNPFLAIYDFKMTGTATGNAEFAGLKEQPGINADVFIKDAGVYDDTLGDASIKFNFETASKTIIASALVDRGGIKNIEIDGKYFIKPITDSLNFNMSLQKTNLSSFAGYAKDIVSDVKGKASGKVNLAGPVNKLLLTGKLMLQQSSFVVDYLNTRYNFSDEVVFTDKYISMKNVTLNDENGNKAKVDGFVYHNHLKDFYLQLDIAPKNFQMLNTTLSQNELFYGNAYGTGNVKIYGPLDMINIDMGIKTEKNTQIFVPLSNPEEVTSSSFIKFINSGNKQELEQKTKIDFSGISMNFELDVTPEAEIQLIFDSKIGDIIKGRGNGNIRMVINTNGDFNMFGNYQVESGDYLFTLQNLINKRFTINQGGTIKWSGDPYDANIDLEAIYKIKASLYDLVQDSTLAERVPVEVHLKLKDNLFNPAINFDIVIPDLNPTSQNVLGRYISTEEQKNKQTMSLLVLNKFALADGVDYKGTSSTGVGANAAELLSQQLSNWASQISTAVNVGVNYRAADAFSSEEFEVIISTNLLNDRITIDGNVGVSDNNRNTSNIVGDFNAEAKISKDGRFRFKVYNKTINNNILNNYNSPYTQGLGILYRQEFDTFGELMKKFRDKFRKKEQSIDTSATN